MSKEKEDIIECWNCGTLYSTIENTDCPQCECPPVNPDDMLVEDKEEDYRIDKDYQERNNDTYFRDDDFEEEIMEL